MQSQIIFRLPKPESLAAAQGRFKMKGILIPLIFSTFGWFSFSAGADRHRRIQTLDAKSLKQLHEVHGTITAKRLESTGPPDPLAFHLPDSMLIIQNPWELDGPAARQFSCSFV